MGLDELIRLNFIIWKIQQSKIKRKIMRKLHKKIKFYLKQFRLFIGRVILDRKPSKEWHRALLPNSKILFIRHDGKIGDFFVSSFVYREIKKQMPNIHIGILAASETQNLFETNHYIDSLYVVKKRSLFQFWLTGWKIRKEQYDIVIDLTDVLRNRDIVLVRCVNAAINVGYNKAHFKLFNYNVALNDEHITLDYENALLKLGFQKIDRHNSLSDIPFSNELEIFYQEKLSKQEYIVINFFGVVDYKAFSAKNRLRWLEKIKEAYPDKRILVLTYPKVTQELKDTLPSDEYLMYEKTSTIFDSVRLIKDAALVITPDTSIVHIAATFNKPILAFYMTSNIKKPRRKWLPVNSENVHIYFYRHNINEIDIDNIQLTSLFPDRNK